MDGTGIARGLCRSVGLCLAGVLVAAGTAWADSGDEGINGGVITSGSRTSDGAQASVGTQTVIPTAGRGAHHGGGAPAILCRFNTIDVANPIGGTGSEVDTLGDLPVGVQVWRSCYNAATGALVDGPSLITTTDAATPRPDITVQLVDQALANIDIELPVPRLSPPAETLPNIDTWFWTDQMPNQQASASAGGVTVTVSAQLTSTSFAINRAADSSLHSTDDGVKVDCPGPPIAYRPDVAASEQKTTCHHRFAAPTRDFTIDVTTTWALGWTATNGRSGDLGEISRTSTAPYRVQAKRTVIRTPS